MFHLNVRIVFCQAFDLGFYNEYSNQYKHFTCSLAQHIYLVLHVILWFPRVMLIPWNVYHSTFSFKPFKNFLVEMRFRNGSYLERVCFSRRRKQRRKCCQSIQYEFYILF